MERERVHHRISRTNETQRQEWVRKFYASGLSRAAFVRKHGLKFATFSGWLERMQESVRPRKSVTFQEVPVGSSAPGSAGPWAVEMVSRSGWTIRVR